MTDLPWVRENPTRHRSRPQIRTIGRMFHAARLPGLIAEIPALGLSRIPLRDEPAPEPTPER